MARTPEVRFRDLLGDHLQIVQRMALWEALATKQYEGIMIGLGLLPPKLLKAIHSRIELRRRATSFQEEQVLASGFGPTAGV